MFPWLDQHASAIQAIASLATVAITLVLAWITRTYVQLTQELAFAAREQLRLQQNNERNDAARLLTMTQVFLSHLQRLPTHEEQGGWRDVTIWKHNDVTQFATLAAAVIGAAPAVQEAIQALDAIRVKVEAARAAEPDGNRAFAWDEWGDDIRRTMAALRGVREAAETAELEILGRSDPRPPDSPPRGRAEAAAGPGAHAAEPVANRGAA